MFTSRFSSSNPICNVFCGELAIFATKGFGARLCWVLALQKTACIMGESEFAVRSQLPENETLEGFVSINGKQIPCKIKFDELNGAYPEVL